MTPEEIEQIIDQWFQETMHDSPVSRDTDAINHVIKSVAELKKRLNERSAQQ